MSNTNRCEVFCADEAGVYHAMNRTTRRTYLIGLDPLTGHDYSYRRVWFRERMVLLATHFCIDVLAYSVLSNHWHAVLRNRPDLAADLTPRQIAVRWLSVTSRAKYRDKNGGEITEAEIRKIINDPERVEVLRKRLSDISWFIRQMCQTIARRCNLEDEVTGHLFGERFKMNRLATEEEVLAAMLYVDLNPLRAGLGDALDDFAEVSINDRLRTLDDDDVDTASWLSPLELESEVDGKPVVVANGLTAAQAEKQAEKREAIRDRLGCIPMRLEAYRELLWHLAIQSRPELQASERLPADIFSSPLRLGGKTVNVEELTERHAQTGRRFPAALDLQARNAIHRNQVAGQSPAPTDNTWATV